MPRAAIARLAARLHAEGERLVAHHLGHAIDKHLATISLTRGQAAMILEMLDAEPVEGLEPPRQSLSGLNGHSKSGGPPNEAA